MTSVERENQVSVLFIGDPHFKVKNYEFIPQFVEKILTILDRNPVDFVVVGGDLLDNHERLDVDPLNQAINFIDQLRTRHPTFVLVGNHDYKNNQQFLTADHWMNALKFWSNVTIVDRVVQHTCNRMKFVLVPYVPPGRFVEAIKTQLEEKELRAVKVVFAHQEFFGCKMGAITSSEGDKWPTDWPLVVSGHIHNKQWPQDNIYYPGSAMQHAFGQSVENTISRLVVRNKEFEYDEINLKMPKLSIKYMTVEDAARGNLRYKNTDRKRYKLVLSGALDEFAGFKKTAVYKQLLEEGFAVSFKIKPSTEVRSVDTLNGSRKFLDILTEKVQTTGDADLESLCKSFLAQG
ncbi:hypothetical protein MIV078R [Invertebrate iridescent virus 3]|uniref:Putative phosphoesterase 078R n=1 Tax=Invertebrate iridescent virus 3 TaxID=345201 RepID=VF244_IIV3|nr:hypothetical protein MIV078R [Invertebrate iridescent virus 3]Q196Y2.1 RecName: Full=Putative phosphoesterase 078R [Invertebrate iridescent virus 3]ABF82108.1 hypothetical protein MIV078R [Invertebrate iridescent virus 3]